MYTSKKQALIALKKSKSVLEKTLSMLESDMGCSDIIVQNMAAI
jgi:DNA-binding FrmR family transcriptional regulator